METTETDNDGVDFIGEDNLTLFWQEEAGQTLASYLVISFHESITE